MYVRAQFGRTLTTQALVARLALRGHFVTLSLSFNAKTSYFAFANPTGQEPCTLPGYAVAPVAPGTK